MNIKKPETYCLTDDNKFNWLYYLFLVIELMNGLTL